MADTTSATITTATENQIHHVNMANITKLTASNFLMWSRQIRALLAGYGLAGYLDVTTVAPDSTILREVRTTSNPEYNLWQRQDQLIVASLLGTISVEIQPILSKASTTTEIWALLTSTYVKPTWGHIKQLREQIKQWRKGTRSIDEYVQGLVSRFNQLATMGKPYEHEEQIEYLLGGLPENYKPIVDQIEGRDSPPTMPAIHEKLINFKLKLQSQASATSVVPVTANVAFNKSYGHSNNNNSRHHRYSSRGSLSSSLRGGHGRGYQGQCQLCGVFGHSAQRCSQLSTSSRGFQPSGGNYSPSPGSQGYPHANTATIPSYNPANLVMDSGATHNLTSDLSNLSHHQPYSGGEEVQIANGSGLKITHTGSALLPTPSSSLALKDVLYVPDL
ncbi:PREDICTED: uncharacterized protein LOC104738119 [Camelina sativa]|uniref:Uncharacterized protein LOC104738119 n=1 Tax=Camelina sativa TaxID=90675 RepID=A0ABM0VIE1_CAMSA|nr:PREDICTED: uncharacterized protein LOC104738119 [Camelina sativa]